MRFVTRHYAFLAEQSRLAAEASECAAEQGKFWDYRQLLYVSQAQVRASQGTPILKSLATQLPINQVAFNACVDSGRYADLVRSESDEAKRLKAPGTPSLFVDDVLVRGAGGAMPSNEELQVAIDQAAAKKGR